ncbi:MAG: OmpA family protein [Flammeovirgaceae bacterium]|nr:OmpA family protein [Flammeovirgaceae bacterium]
MKIRFFYLFILLLNLFLGFSYCFAQNKPLAKESFKSKDTFQKTRKAINEGDEWIEMDQDYDKALKHYLIAYKYFPSNAELNFKIGTSYLNTDLQDKTNAIGYLETARKLDKNIDYKINYLIGHSYHLAGDWNMAIEHFEKFLRKKNLSNEEKKAAKKNIEACENGKALAKNPVRVFIDNMGKRINSAYPEFGMVIKEDGSKIYFTARKPRAVGNVIDGDSYYFEDIYEASKLNGNWSRIKNMGKPINTAGHDAVIGFSPKEDKLLIYRGSNNGDIYFAQRKGKSWQEPQKVSGAVNSKYRETSASLSPDGNTLYFTSDRPENNKGGLDIYISKRNSRTGWTIPKNLGKTINSPYDEEAVFMHPDGKTLYFCSKGHNSIGGFDVFKSVFENDKWSTPINLGIPINTAGDDLFMAVSADHKTGYYATFRKDGLGEKDLYKVTFLGPEKHTETDIAFIDFQEKTENFDLKSLIVNHLMEKGKSKLIPFEGLIVEGKDGNPVKAKLILTDLDKNEIIEEIYSNEKNGGFSVTLTTGINYGITVSADGFLFHSENIFISKKEKEKIHTKIELSKLESGSKIVLNNVFFDSDKFDLKPTSEAELKNLVTLLKENPELKVEISGHTDNVGNEAYNLELSRKRAISVVKKLMKAGIEINRLKPVGYGSKSPMASNETEEGKQQNRRTEFKIL